MPRKPFSGKSKAYLLFSSSLWRIKQLIDFGVVGIDAELEKNIQPHLTKLESVKGIRGRIPKNFAPSFKEVHDEKAGVFSFIFDQRSAAFYKRKLELRYKRHDELRYFFYANLATSLWAAFETYNTTLFEELFRLRPEMLKSSEQLTVKEVVDNRDDLVEFIIERQLEIIGHFRLKEIVEYYKKKTGIEVSDERLKRLEPYYLVRNLIAHKNGVVRPRQKIKVSKDLYIVGDEVRVTKTFLLRMANLLESNVKFIEAHACEKYFKLKPN